MKKAIQTFDEAVTRAKNAGLTKEQLLAEVAYIFDNPEEPEEDE